MFQFRVAGNLHYRAWKAIVSTEVTGRGAAARLPDLGLGAGATPTFVICERSWRVSGLLFWGRG
ncbi:MAG TPA: hypothetical protein QGH10_17485 [Armatimonadota bacterium]|nr:hypothetical protein [Armatimonadota bacterium]